MAEQHEKALVPQIRFTGFTDPWEQRKLSSTCEQLSRTINPLETPNEEFTEYSMPAFDNNETAETVIGNSMNSLRKIVDRPCLLVNKLNVRKKRIWHVPRPEANAVCSSEFVPFSSHSSDLSFIKISLLSERITAYLESCSSGSSNSQKRVTPEIIMSSEIIAPSLAEQRRIGAFFDRLDSLITLHQGKYDKLCVLKKSMLDKMFPKGGSLYPEIRFAGFTDPWEQRRLGELCSFAKGRGYSKIDIRDSGVPLILYGRLYTQYQTKIEEVDTFTVEKDGSLLSKGNEVIVPASGETAEDIAVASSVRRPGIIFGGDLNVLTPGDALDPDYVALGITYGSAHSNLAKRAQGKSVVHVHNADIAMTELAYPSIDEQRAISILVLKLDSLIALHQRELDQVKELKKGLLQQMFV